MNFEGISNFLTTKNGIKIINSEFVIIFNKDLEGIQVSDELVKYHNSMNSIVFSGFNHKDYNIFYSIVSRMRDKGTRKITFSYRYLMKLSGLNYGNRLSRFSRDLDNTYNKMMQLGIRYNNPHHVGHWVLFTGFDIDKDKHTVTIKVNPDLVGVLNNLVSNFTRFSLLQFTSIRSPYCQALYRILKEFRQTGYVYMPMQKFRVLLDVPKAYNADLINRHILNPIRIELTPLVRGLHVIPKKRGRGGRVIGYKFTFTPQNAKADYFSRGKKQDLKIMIKNIRFNDFLTPSLKTKALSRIKKAFNKSENYHAKKHVREPMKIFNRTLKQASLDDLKQLYQMRKTPAVNMSEYQTRKLRKTINKKSIPK